MLDSRNLEIRSMVRRLDPRVKIVAVTLFSIIMALCSRWSALIPGLFISLLFVLFSRLPLNKVFMRLLLVNGLILFLWLFIPFSYKGETAFTFGPFTATKQGIEYAALLTLRSNIIVLAFICLVFTTSIFTLGRAMRKLWIPDKMVQLFFFTYRYLHVIHLEYQRMVNALKIRGFQPNTNIHTYRTYAYLVGMLLVRSYDRSESIRNAMLCRGFRGRFYDLGEFSLKTCDFVTMFVISMTLIIITLLQWTTVIY